MLRNPGVTPMAAVKAVVAVGMVGGGLLCVYWDIGYAIAKGLIQIPLQLRAVHKFVLWACYHGQLGAQIVWHKASRELVRRARWRAAAVSCRDCELYGTGR